MGKMTLDELQSAGFHEIAEWCRDEAGDVICRGNVPDTTGLYLFSVASEVRYVGAAWDQSAAPPAPRK
jgi:hypothetical protein